jgi:long-chain fatty acid transport protein
MKKVMLKTTLSLAIGMVSTQLLASGFAVNEQSISGMGTGFAGRSSSADDASTIYGNPAGMSRIKREQISLGAAVIDASTDIRNGSGRPFGGTNDGDMVPLIAAPMGYYVKPIDEHWAFGVGVYAPFGLVTQYEHNFAGRYFAKKSDVKVITLQPTVSYAFNDKISIGFGPTINHISGQLTSAVPTVSPAGVGPDGEVKVKGDDNAVGYNIGVLAQITDRARVGLTYHSMVNYKLEGNTQIDGLGFGPFSGTKYAASLALKTPESADASVTYDLNDDWTLYAGSTFTRWSRLQNIVVNNEGVPAPLAAGGLGTITEEQNWHNTWAHAIGAAYKLNKQWTLRTGFSVDQSPTNNTDRSPRIPTGDRKAISFGAAYSPTDDVTIDMAYSYLKEEDTTINLVSPTKGAYSATYKNSASGFGTSVTYRF